MTATVVGCGNRWGRKKRGYDSRRACVGSGGMETDGVGRKEGRKKGLALSLALLGGMETGGVGRKGGMIL